MVTPYATEIKQLSEQRDALRALIRACDAPALAREVWGCGAPALAARAAELAATARLQLAEVEDSLQTETFEEDRWVADRALGGI